MTDADPAPVFDPRASRAGSEISIAPDGSKRWTRGGRLHREDGPAIEWADGTKQWCLNGQLHRDDGPALEYPDGREEWWRAGKRWPEGAAARKGLQEINKRLLFLWEISND